MGLSLVPQNQWYLGTQYQWSLRITVLHFHSLKYGYSVLEIDWLNPAYGEYSRYCVIVHSLSLVHNLIDMLSKSLNKFLYTSFYSTVPKYCPDLDLKLFSRRKSLFLSRRRKRYLSISFPHNKKASFDVRIMKTKAIFQ